MSALQGDGASPTIDPGEVLEQQVLDQFHGFPFSSDEAFQQGLSRILAHESISQMRDDERAELVLKTKVFYFNLAAGRNISLAQVQADHGVGSDSKAAQSGNEAFWGAEQEEIRTLTFAELKSLIEQGNTDNIPNNKIIPNILNDGVPSESTVPLRKKPWEDARLKDGCVSEQSL